MMAEIYYEVDEFNKLYLEKIAGYASNIEWYPKRKIGCLSMSEIMTILIFIITLITKILNIITNNTSVKI